MESRLRLILVWPRQFFHSERLISFCTIFSTRGFEVFNIHILFMAHLIVSAKHRTTIPSNASSQYFICEKIVRVGAGLLSTVAMSSGKSYCTSKANEILNIDRSERKKMCIEGAKLSFPALGVETSNSYRRFYRWIIVPGRVWGDLRVQIYTFESTMPLNGKLAAKLGTPELVYFRRKISDRPMVCSVAAAVSAARDPRWAGLVMQR